MLPLKADYFLHVFEDAPRGISDRFIHGWIPSALASAWSLQMPHTYWLNEQMNMGRTVNFIKVSEIRDFFFFDL